MKKQSERWLATAKRRRWNRDDAVRALEAVAASGETIDAFARRHGLIPERLYRWRRRFERTANVAARATAPVEALADVLPRLARGVVIARDIPAMARGMARRPRRRLTPSRQERPGPGVEPPRERARAARRLP